MSDRKIELEKQEELKARKQEEIIKNYKDYCLSHNKKPVSRRDLLGAGVFGFTASMTLPTLATLMMPSEARAQSDECATAGAASSTLAPFITLNLAGGAGLAANYVPTDQGGQLLPTYSRMGLGDNQLTIENEFGNVPFAGDDGTGVLISKLLTGIRANASAATLANTAFIAIPVRSRDDSGMNLFDVSGLVTKAGLVGSQLPNLGRRQTETGINQMYAGEKPPTPLVVGSYDDINSALALGAGAINNWTDTQKVSLVKMVEKLSTSQMNRVNAFAGGRTLATLVKCATAKNVELSENPPPSLDVRQDASLAGVWGVDGNSNARDESVVFGSMVNAALQRNAGTVSLEKGGYDYHNGTRTTGDTRDGEAGDVIGRVLESAAALNQKVFLYVTSDGSVNSEESNARDSVWRSDRGSAGMAYILAYDPAGRPSTTGHQIGQFTDGQAADDNFVTGDNVALAASAAVANYLQFSGQDSLISSVLGGVFSSSDLTKILKFG